MLDGGSCLFDFTEEDLFGTEVYATASRKSLDTNSKKLLANIDAARDEELRWMLVNLSVRHMDPTAARTLA